MKRSNYIFVIMLAVTQVIFSQDESWKLFDDTEVDEVHITIDSLRLEWIYENVYSDSLHPSTVHYVSEWFDETIDSVRRKKWREKKKSWRKGGNTAGRRTRERSEKKPKRGRKSGS